MIGVSKIDLLDDELKLELKAELDNELNTDYVFISSIAQIGIIELKDLLWQQLNK